MIGSGPIGSAPVASIEEYASAGVLAEVPVFAMEFVPVAPATLHKADIPPAKISFRAGQSLFTSAQKRPTIFFNSDSGVGNIDWINLSDAITANDTPASVSLGGSDTSDYLGLRGFGFPFVDATPKGLSIDLRVKKNTGVAVSVSAQVMKDGGNFNVNVDSPPGFTPVGTTYAVLNGSANFQTGVITAAEVSSDLFGIGILAQAQGSAVVVSVDDVLVSISYTSGITIKKTVGIGPIAMEFITIAPSGGTDDPTVGPFVMEFVTLVPTTKHVFTVPVFAMEFASLTPTTKHTVLVAPFVMEFASITPATMRFISISSFAMEFIGITPSTPAAGDIQSFEFIFSVLSPESADKNVLIPPFKMSIRGIEPSTEHLVGVIEGGVVMAFIQSEPSSSKAVPVPSMAIDFVFTGINNATFHELPPVSFEFVSLALSFAKSAEVPAVIMAFAFPQLPLFPRIFIGIHSIKGLSSGAIVGTSGVHILGMD